jgi:dihydrofolate reductase
MGNVKIIAIAAVSTDGVIGIDNEIPWRIPEDFKHFRDTTMGNMLLVGYNTYLTLPEKAFEGRHYIVLNGGNHFQTNRLNVYQFSNLDVVLNLFERDCNFDYLFVAGGAMVYDTMIDHCDECIITWVNKLIPNGNKKFPINKLFANFGVISDQDWLTSKTGEQYRIAHYKRK